MGELTHIDRSGEARMVDVSGKEETEREAVASGKILMSSECLAKVKAGDMKKGDVLGCARIAGIMGCKKTSELIPLCHNLMLTKAEVKFSYLDDESGILATCRVKTVGKTGAEMEALTGVNTALLTIYDMCKAVEKGMQMTDIHLISKSGGKSGDWKAEA